MSDPIESVSTQLHSRANNVQTWNPVCRGYIAVCISRCILHTAHIHCFLQL